MADSPLKRNRVFISYSHKDQAYVDRFRVFLKPWLREHLLEVWDDTQIGPGDNWQEKILEALAAAQVAILFVSSDYLASDFISQEELPRLLEASNRDGAVILPVVVSPSLFRRSKLSRFQAVNDPSKPLSGLSEPEQDLIWEHLVEKVLEAFEKQPPTVAAIPSIESANTVTRSSGSVIQPLNIGDISTTPNSESTTDPNPLPELNENALFSRLSPSSHQALNEADGLRTAMGLAEIHMEDLIVGLFAKKDGPTEELLGKANIDMASFGTIIQTTFPQLGTYKTPELTSFPPMSSHVRKALLEARHVASLHGSDSGSSHFVVKPW